LIKRAGTETRYGLDGSEFEYRQGKNFSPLQVVLIGSGAHPASYPMGTEGEAPNLGVKWTRREADYSPPTCAEVRNMWIYVHIYPTILLHGVVVNYLWIRKALAFNLK
jgi:hypothetical protein